MADQQTVSLQNALDVVEALPGFPQDDLVDIVRRRRVEQRREALARSIRDAREAYARGEVRRATVDELLKELSE